MPVRFACTRMCRAHLMYKGEASSPWCLDCRTAEQYEPGFIIIFFNGAIAASGAEC